MTDRLFLDDVTEVVIDNLLWDHQDFCNNPTKANEDKYDASRNDLRSRILTPDLAAYLIELIEMHAYSSRHREESLARLRVFSESNLAPPLDEAQLKGIRGDA